MKIIPEYFISRQIINQAGTILFWSGVVYFCLYKLWLVSVLQFTVPMFYPHDHTWFFKKALSINFGQWFGEYNHYTLIKGPIYSLFLSSLSSLGISPKLAIDGLYVLASLIFLLALRNVLKSRVGVLMGFVLVLCNPITFSSLWSYPLRMNLYVPLILIYLSSVLALVSNSYKNPEKVSIGWGLLCAISLALAWNTREESIWLISGLFPYSFITIWQIWKKQSPMPALIVLLLIITIPWLTWNQLANVNQDRYGYKGTVDVLAPQFLRASNAIYSLNTGNQRHIYMNQETREKMEHISPNTQRLISKLVYEDGSYSKYRTNSHGGSAAWRIRSGMNKNGYYASFKESEEAYKQIADDIESYCQLDDNNCRKIYIDGMLVKPNHFKYMVGHAIFGIKDMVKFNSFPPTHRSGYRRRGDAKFQYVVNRFFNINTSLDSSIDNQQNIAKIERKRKEKLDMIYRNYQQYMGYIIIFSIGVFIFTLFRKNQWPVKMTGLTLISAYAGGFGIYVLVSTFAVPHLDRLLVSAFIPLLCFTGFFLALAVQLVLSELNRKFGLAIAEK